MIFKRRLSLVLLVLLAGVALSTAMSSDDSKADADDLQVRFTRRKDANPLDDGAKT